MEQTLSIPTYFNPRPWQGTPDEFTNHNYYPWVQKIDPTKKVWCLFWLGWGHNYILPPGYDYYLISYQIENVDLAWLIEQSAQVQGKIIVLYSGRLSGSEPNISKVTFVPYINWHNDCQQITNWWGVQDTNWDKKYKYSAVCNRTTQSKIWITTQLLETAQSDSLLILNNQSLESKNVHHWQKSNNEYLDRLTDSFLDKYINLKLTDNFNQEKNHHSGNSNPWQPLYTDTVLHFTNSSFQYSLMHDNLLGNYIWPGPDIDEKTWKCLLAGTAFIACAQFDTHGTLEMLGFNFDYGFDMSWDQDPGNLTRFEKICKLIDTLNNYSLTDLIDMVKLSTDYNKNHILSGEFSLRCEKFNEQSVELIFKELN